MEQAKLLSWIVFGFCVARYMPAISKSRVDWFRSFAFRYLAPCLFFSSVYNANLHYLPPVQVIFAYGLCLAALFFILRSWLFEHEGHSSSASNIKALSALYPNAVGVGMPLIFALYGVKAELILMGVIVFNLLAVLPMVNVLMIRAGEQGFYRYRKVIGDPIIIAIVSGLLLNMWGIELDLRLVNMLAYIGWFALPFILFLLGASLSFYSFRSLIQEKVALLLAVKIVMFPLLIWLNARFIFQLTTIETQVLVLLASLPTGLNVYLLSERYQTAKAATAGVIAFTTVLSLVSILGWEWALNKWS